jgi:hypothetical protein
MGNSVEKERSKVYEVLLCSPGMNDNVKVNFQMSRKEIFLLSRVIEAGLSPGVADGMTSLIGEESRQAYRAVIEDILKKAGLSDFVEKLKYL